MRPNRSNPAPRQQLFYCSGLTLRLNENTTIGQIAHRSGKSKCQRFLAGAGTKKNALHMTIHRYLNCPHTLPKVENFTAKLRIFQPLWLLIYVATR